MESSSQEVKLALLSEKVKHLEEHSLEQDKLIRVLREQVAREHEERIKERSNLLLWGVLSLGAVVTTLIGYIWRSHLG